MRNRVKNKGGYFHHVFDSNTGVVALGNLLHHNILLRQSFSTFGFNTDLDI